MVKTKATTQNASNVEINNSILKANVITRVEIIHETFAVAMHTKGDEREI